jgi:integrase
MATKVTLREKSISGNRLSLYLDFYPPITDPETGKPTRRQFLGMYIMEKPKTPLEKEGNKETRLLGEQLRQKRENELNKPEVYSDHEKDILRRKELGERNFIEYFKELADKREGGNRFGWLSTYHNLTAFAGEYFKCADLTEKWCNDFREFLINHKGHNKHKKLSLNSVAAYFGNFKHALKEAYSEGLIASDLGAKVKAVTKPEVHREFLSLEELNALVEAHCENPILKQAALFSALTGLRFSDIHKLTWSEVRQNEKGYFLTFTQQKTRGVEVLPISEQAYFCMGERKNDSDQVFEGLKRTSSDLMKLRLWTSQAGIKRHITFHSFRHTYATLQLSAGTDIYTVSKLLGHRSLLTTQIYAKVVDDLKRKATERIKLNF